MSAISDIISNSIEASATRSIRAAVGNIDPRLRSLTEPVMGKAIDDIKSKVLGVNTTSARGASPGNAQAGINARGDALQNWSWYALLPSLSGSGKTLSLPWYYVQTANLPQRTIQSDSAQMNGHAIHYAESYSVEQLQLGMFMDTTNKAQEYLLAWQSLILGNADATVAQNQGMWGLPSEYKKEINIALLSPDRSIVLNAKYINCWPLSPGSLDLNSSQADALIQNVSFAVEDVSFGLFNTAGPMDNFSLGSFGLDTLSSRVGLSGLFGSSVFQQAVNTFQGVTNGVTNNVASQVFNI